MLRDVNFPMLYTIDELSQKLVETSESNSNLLNDKVL